MEEHGCWISQKTYSGMVVRYRARCRCGWEGPERIERHATLTDRAEHKARVAAAEEQDSATA
jgi:hypothetical protein